MDTPELTETERNRRLHALLTPLGRVQPVRARSRSRLPFGVVRIPILVGLMVALLVVAVLSPWDDSRDPFFDQALAALGSDRYFRAVFEMPVEFNAVIDLRTGHRRPALRRIDVSHDELTDAMSFTTYVDGAFAGRVSGTPDPVLRHFTTGFREALADGTAEIVDHRDVFGRRVAVLRLPGDSEAGEVAVDIETYQPVGLRPGRGNGAWLRVLTVESLTAAEADSLSENVQEPPVDHGSATTIGAVPPAETSQSFGSAAVWAGADVGGIPLREILVQRLTTFRLPDGSKRVSLGLLVQYEEPPQWLEIAQSADWHVSYGFYGPTSGNDGPVPPPGSMRVSCDACGATEHAPGYRPIWTGQLRRSGLYVRIRAPSDRLLIEAARGLSEIDEAHTKDGRSKR